VWGQIFLIQKKGIGLGKMNAAGQALIEYVLLLAVFLLLIARIAQSIPSTFSSASPYLGAKIEQHLETGNGFHANGQWLSPYGPKGGVK
jgi:hypothetical protein